MAEVTGVLATKVRESARLYASAGNAAIYYGLGVTEHAQGSTGVMAIANLAMATGNVGREGVGVSPLRGENNVQGSGDMGSSPHEFSAIDRWLTTKCARRSSATGDSSLRRSRACASRTCLTLHLMDRSRRSTSRARMSRTRVPSILPSGSRPA